MKATKQYFVAVLFIMLYKVALTFECMEEFLKCNHSNESCWALLLSGAAKFTKKVQAKKVRNILCKNLLHCKRYMQMSTLTCKLCKIMLAPIAHVVHLYFDYTYSKLRIL